MRTNRVLQRIGSIVGLPFLPLQFLTTLVLGLLVTITFGLLLLPISIIWLVLFLGPLLGLSWLWLHAPPLRLPLAMLGVPWAIVGRIYVQLMPSMGDMYGRIQKLLIAETWPYSLPFWRWDLARQGSGVLSLAEDLQTVIVQAAEGDPLQVRYLQDPTSIPRG